MNLQLLPLLILLICSFQTPARAFLDCDFWYLSGPGANGKATQVRTDYWHTVGPSGVGNDINASYSSWSNCGPSFPDIVSSISIVSLDTPSMSRLCKVDIRTRGQQSYSFGDYCDGGLPQTLEIWPGERILDMTNVFMSHSFAKNQEVLDAYGVSATPLIQPQPPTWGEAIVAPDFDHNELVQVDSLLCLKTSYGDTLRSGKGACSSRTNATRVANNLNSGLLAGVGGTTMLDESGTAYLSSLVFIFHPWPKTIKYDLSSIQFLDPPASDRVAVQSFDCSGVSGYCNMLPALEAQCSASIDMVKEVSFTMSDSTSLSFGVAESQALVASSTTGTDNAVSLSNTGTDGVSITQGSSQSSSTAQETSEGITVSKEKSDSVNEQNTLSAASTWSDSKSSGQANSFSRSKTEGSSVNAESSRTQEQTQGTAISSSSTEGQSSTLESGQTKSQETSSSTTVSEDMSKSEGVTNTEGTAFSSSNTKGIATSNGGSVSGTVTAGVSATITNTNSIEVGRRKLLDADGVPASAWEVTKMTLHERALYAARSRGLSGDVGVALGTTEAAKLGLLGQAKVLQSGPHILPGPGLGCAMVPGLGAGKTGDLGCGCISLNILSMLMS
eukprot:gene18803-25349_t